MIGATLSHFRILELLGRGGFGEVYKAQDTVLGRLVAVKVLPRDFAENPERRERFRREAKAASQLTHPNICVTHEFGEAEGVAFIAMEYVEGSTLRARIQARSLTLETSLRMGAQIADGLAAAHQKGILHRDVKSDNVLVTLDEQVKILDFGLATHVAARALGDDALTATHLVTSPGTAMGTVGYMSPEQLSGLEVDYRSDVFSLGVVLYEMVTGQLPFRGKTAFETAAAILHNTPEDPQRTNPRVNAGLSQFLLHLLTKDPTQRNDPARSVASDLRRLLRELEGGLDLSGATPTPTPASTSALRRMVVTAPASIAVLPFANLSGDKENDYFSDGLSEELISALTRLPGLRVASRTSAFAFKGENRDIRDIGQALGVQHVLEGSVRRAGERLRVTAQLINAGDGYHVWSERYDRDSRDVFAVQDEIARTIVERLKLRLVRDRPLIRRYTDDAEAHSLYLKGRYFWNRRYHGGLQKALEFFRQALERDPEYALPYTGLADCYNILGFYNYLPPLEAFPRARAAAERALGVDAELAEGHCSLGLAAGFHYWDWPAAEDHLRQAVALDGANATCHYWLAAILAVTGRAQESLEQIARGKDADPLSGVILGASSLLHLLAGDAHAALNEARRAEEVDEHSGPVRWFLARALVGTGAYDEAVTAFDQAGQQLGEIPLVIGHRAHAHALAGRGAEARQQLAALQAVASERYVSQYFVGLVWAGLGECDAALGALEAAVEERTNWLGFLAVDPAWRALRDEPRYQVVVERLGLAGVRPAWK